MIDDQKLIEVIRDLLKKQNVHQKDILSLAEATEYMDLSHSFLYKLTSENKITHFKPGGKKIYFKKDDIDQWLLQNRSESISEAQSGLLETLKRESNGNK